MALCGARAPGAGGASDRPTIGTPDIESHPYKLRNRGTMEFERNPDGPGLRGCVYLTRAGEPCTAPAVSGEEACSGHSGRLGFDPKEARAIGVRKARERSEQRKLSAADYLAQVLERNAVAVGERLLAVGLTEDWRALAFLFERAYGKAVETVRQEASAEGMSLPELRQLRDRLLAAHPELRSVPLLPPEGRKAA